MTGVQPELRFMAARLKKIRLKLKLSREELASLTVDGGPDTIADYEEAKVDPPQSFVVLMSLLDNFPSLLDVVRTTRIRA